MTTTARRKSAPRALTGLVTFSALFLAALLFFAVQAAPGHGAESNAKNDSKSWNSHILERLQSPERQAEIERARRHDDAGREERAQREAQTTPLPDEPAHSLDIGFLEGDEGSGDAYTLRAEPDWLVAGVESDVLLSIAKNGQPVESGLEVLLETGEGLFNLHALPRKTTKGGKLLLKGLRADAPGPVTLRFSVNGRAGLPYALTVRPPSGGPKGNAAAPGVR